MPSLHPSRTMTAAAVAVAAAASLAPAAAAAGPAKPVPNATAKQHGITHPGDATMGWKNKTASKSAPTSGTNPKASALAQSLRVSGPNTSTRALATISQTAGLDLSQFTQGLRWSTWKNNGVRFTYIKASEGTYNTNPQFNSEYSGATSAGLVRGAYHFANPAVSDAKTQADYFVNHGGGWSRDGRTLPGALDMEWNPYSGNSCYNKTPAQLQAWVADFVGRYKTRTGTRPVIYTASAWWNMCMGTTPKWTATPLWIADYHSTRGALPAAWSGSTQKIWQNAAYNTVGYDTDLFNGNETALRRFATTGAA